MLAFDSATFDPVAFDSGLPKIVDSSFSLSARVSNPALFDSGEHYVGFLATVYVGNIDVSRRISGRLTISAAEESGRLAQFDVTPLSSSELASYDGAAVTIDFMTWRAGNSSTYRRFTGKVEGVEFDDSQLNATLSCRDGYQERIAAAGSAVAVQKLLGGLETVCDALCAWSDTTPDPAGYFSKLLATCPGSVFIDGNGLWRAFRWTIGPEKATFGPGNYYDGSLSVSLTSRLDMPAAIDASLTIRVMRLHSVEVPVTWEGVTYDKVGLGLGNWPSKACVQEALSGCSGWFVKGQPTLGSPSRSGYVLPLPGGGVASMMLDNPDSICVSASAIMYHRWYQSVDHKYTISLALGGASDRDTSIADSIQTSWDATAWEQVQESNPSVGIYAANPPLPTTTPKTGYEALPAPWPPANSAIDYFPDLTESGIASAGRYVVAKALRAATAGRRKRRIKFARPIDPRLDISDVVSVSGPRVSATGQIVDFSDSIDFDSGEVTSVFTLACPAGTGISTALGSVTFVPPAANVMHNLPGIVLGNFFGASNTMNVITDDSRLLGYLANVTTGAAPYDDTKPIYTPQFRLIMPGVPAELRDPTTTENLISADFSIGGGVLEIDF